MSRKPPADAPESLNRSQWDEGQAQDVARSARDVEVGPGPTDSRHGGATDPAQIIPDDTPDLVDKMTEMVRSGRIDTDAYIGEPVHDDQESLLGAAATDRLGIEDDPAAEGLDDDSVGLLENVPDTGESPLALMASERGLADRTDPDMVDADDEDTDDDLDDDDEDLDDEDLLLEDEADDEDDEDEDDELEELSEDGFGRSERDEDEDD